MKIDIYTESPERAIWGELANFENELIARDYLKERYSQLNVEYPDRLSFRNVTPFLIYIRQARQIFQSANEITNWMKPTHLYYGMMSLLKALILTLDPTYPQNSYVLKHGISTKKKKKELFRFLFDDIRVQKEGLFPHYQTLFSNHSRTDYNPIQLMQMIPDIQDAVYKVTQCTHFLPITVSESEETILVTFPNTVLDHYKYSHNRFVEWLNSKSKDGSFLLVDSETRTHFQASWSGKQVIRHPYIYQNKKGDYFVWIRNNHLIEPIPEVEAEYLLLFSLSMLSRYEPPLWAEVMDTSTSMEGILIQELLRIVQRKFPNLILNQLYGKEYVYFIR